MRKPNKGGCVPTEDVCMAHEMPLLCRHGCAEQIPFTCQCKTTHAFDYPYDEVPRFDEKEIEKWK